MTLAFIKMDNACLSVRFLKLLSVCCRCKALRCRCTQHTAPNLE